MTSKLGEFIEDVRQEQKLPDILAERCVHGKMESASCRSCVESCPQGAWLLDDAALSLNTQACDGCGLCMPACPESAIRVRHEIVIGHWQDSSIALCACEVAQSPETEGVIPCVHAIGLAEVLRLYRKGVIQWYQLTADCDSCPRGQSVHLTDRLDALNRSLQASDLVGIGLSPVSATQWQKLHAKLGGKSAGPPLSRRGFLTGFVSSSVRQGMELIGLFNDAPGPATPPGQLLPHSITTVWPCLPVIDSSLCNGCDACARLCPHGAIRLEKADGQISYQIKPQDCSGCRICVDVCDQRAVSLIEWELQSQLEILLTAINCTACGNPFHVPAGQSANPQAVCRICAQRNHNKNLYQVLN